MLQSLLELLPKFQGLVKIRLYVGSVLRCLDDSQKHWIILHYEVYVKKMLLYHGCQCYSMPLFGKSPSYPTLPAKTTLRIKSDFFKVCRNFFQRCYLYQS